MHRILLACAAVVALVAGAAFPARAEPGTILMVYRSDARGPAEIFATGFSGRGQRMDLLAHTLGGACDEPDPARASMWVSTSGEREEAVGFVYDYLSNRPSGPENRMWLYTIRPDVTYMHVPSVIRQAADAGEAGQRGYTEEQARVLDHLVQNSLIANEQEVVTHFVAPANILSAVPVWFDANDEIVFGDRQLNPAYRDLHTAALTEVDDLQAFVPAASIRLGLLDDDGPSSGSDSDQCAMSCDDAAAMSSFAVSTRGIAPQCLGPKRASTPMLMDVVLGE